MASILPAGLRNGVKGLDANRYATKKTVAQGMLDIALLTSNASQLKYVLQVGPKHEFYTLLVVLISISIVLQAYIIAGIHYVYYLLGKGYNDSYHDLLKIPIPYSAPVFGGDAIGTCLVAMGMVLLSLNLLRDCRFHKPQHRQSALGVNYLTTAAAFVITVLNVMVSAFDSSLARYLELDYA